jgi:uncharacterized protein (TIGR02231 family)
LYKVAGAGKLKQPFQENTVSPICKTTAFFITAATALSPLALAAERFDARSTVEAATLYPQGAEVTRRAKISLPVGTHELEFFDIPAAHEGTQPQGLQTIVTGAELGPISMSTGKPVEKDLLTSDAAIALQAEIEDLQNQVDAAERKIESISLERTAAEDALRFINELSAPEGASAEDIIAFAQAIRAQSLEVRLVIQNTELRVQDAREATKDSTLALNDAKAALQRLITTTEYRNKITLEVSVEEAGEVEVEFTYLEKNAGWTPQYQADVDTVGESLTLKRTMAAVQRTGEPWIDVALSFATEQTSVKSSPGEISEWVRRIQEPEAEPRSGGINWEGAKLDAALKRNDVAADFAVSASLEPLNFTPQSRSYGLNLTFDYARPATLYSSNMGSTEFALEALTLTPELYVRAVPLHDETGYLVADITNDSGEVILPGTVKLFRDGALIGSTHLPTQADGAEFEMAFGPIDGIRVARVVLDRNQGDRGILSKSNESSSKVRLEVENLTSRDWAVELVDRVSVSEREDLTVEWTASPMPSQTNVEDKRGVLAWHFDLKAGGQQEVSLEENIRWPEGYILR